MYFLKDEDNCGLFLLSGEESSIPLSELEALVRIYNPNSNLLPISRRLVLAKNVNTDSIDIISRRGAYVYIGGRFVTSLRAEFSREDLNMVNFRPFFQKGESYAIRMMGTRNEKVKVELENLIGSAVKKQLSRAKACLSGPDVLIWGRRDSDQIYLGCTRNWNENKGWRLRRPRSKPFFHASALYPKFARALVNLAMVREREIIIDPFCGTGTLIQEAALMNIEAIGIDLDKKMCRGTFRNLKYMTLKLTSIIRSDSTFLPINNVDGIAADLPYGRCSSTKGKTLISILDSVLHDMVRILPHGKKGTLVFPKDINMVLPADLVMTQRHEIFVHKHLTRVVAVLERR